MPEPSAILPGVAAPALDVVLGRNGPRWEPAEGGSGSGFGERVRPGVEIPLGRCTRLPGGQLTRPDSAWRRTARPMTRPRVGFGLTPAGGLLWAPATWAIRTIIDTSAADFGSTPRYAAWIANRPDMSGLVGPFLSLSSFYPDRFTARLTAISLLGDSAVAVQMNLMGRAAAIRIAWVGVESNAGCSTNPPGGFV